MGPLRGGAESRNNWRGNFPDGLYVSINKLKMLLATDEAAKRVFRFIHWEFYLTTHI